MPDTIIRVWDWAVKIGKNSSLSKIQKYENVRY